MLVPMVRAADLGGPSAAEGTHEEDTMAQMLTRTSWGSEVTPWHEFDFLSDRLRNIMEPMMGEPMMSTHRGAEAWIPAVELTEADGEYVLSAELPGIAKSDVQLSIDDGVLTLRGEKKSERKEERGKMHYRERRYGSFERSFTLPRNVDVDKIKAEFKDGIVEVHLPRGEETKGRTIDLK